MKQAAYIEGPEAAKRMDATMRAILAVAARGDPEARGGVPEAIPSQP